MHMALAISHDDRILATYGAHTTLWDLESGRKLHVMNGPFGRDLAFSPDDRTLVSAAGIAWDVKSGKQLQMLDHGESTHLYSSVAFSPDGNTLAVLSNDALQLWQAASLDEIESYRPTHDAMLKRGVVHNEQKRHADAERILRRLFELQQKHLQPDDPNIGRTRSEIKRSLIGQGKMPVIARQPESKTGNLGDEITFRVEFAEPSPLDSSGIATGRRSMVRTRPNWLSPSKVKQTMEPTVWRPPRSDAKIRCRFAANLRFLLKRSWKRIAA